ncbi:TB2/DP1, HVA22 family-domain-containing protein [Sporodiniella umbellata]|nr:TB2/DP1, HVA22 family-domain-containing protein [Sporodiniella umbellata]
MSAAQNTFNSFKSTANGYIASLDRELAKQPYLVQLEQKSGCPKSYAVMVVSTILFLLTFFNQGARLITSLLSWIYPAYASFKAMETATTQDDTQWLTYWTVIALVQTVEYFSNFILSWFPFYYTFKAIFTLWLILPQFKGAEVMYTRFLRPVILNRQPQVVKKSQ